MVEFINMCLKPYSKPSSKGWHMNGGLSKQVGLQDLHMEHTPFFLAGKNCMKTPKAPQLHILLLAFSKFSFFFLELFLLVNGSLKFEGIFYR